MPIELKEIINALGVTDIDPEKNTIEDFNNSFNSHFIRQTDVLKDETIKSKIVGNVLGKLSTHAAQTFGLTKQDVDGVKFEEILGKIKGKYDSQINELSEKAGQGNDEKLTATLKKLGELESQLKIKEQGLVEWQQKYENVEKESNGKIKELKINYTLGKVKESLAPKFSDEYTKNELVKTGFDTHINNTYIFDLDENDTPVVKLKKTGEFVKSKKKSGAIATPDEVLEMEMDAKGVLKKNNADTNKKLPIFVPAKEGEQKAPAINPNALERIAKLQNR